MCAGGRSIVALICTYFILIQQISGNPGCTVGNPVKLTFSCESVNCQNGGTQVNSYTCACPGGLHGKHCNHSLYVPFDTLQGLTLMQGTQQSSFDTLSQGWINSAVSTNRAQSQWIDLGFHPEVCLTQRYLCGAAGAAVSLWLRIIDCPRLGGIITTRATFFNPGFNLYCEDSSNLQYFLLYPSGRFQGDLVPVPRSTFGGWFQIVFNLIGPNDGQGFSVYHNGELVQNVTTKSVFRNFPRIGRIVIGRRFTASNIGYSSVHMDELMFYNQPLTEAEIIMLGQ